MIHQRKILKAIAYAILLCFTSLTGAQPLYAVPANTQLPTPGELGVIGTVDNPVYGPGNTMTINQQTQTAVNRWENFSIGADASVVFTGPQNLPNGFNSLNYVANGGPISEIYGQLTALGGNIFIANPAGVQIGNSAQINVGSLYVTNKDIGSALDGIDEGSTKEQIIDAIQGPSVAATNAELMSLGAIVNAKNVTFDGGRIVLDTDRIYADNAEGELQPVDDAKLTGMLNIITNDKDNVVLGYTNDENATGFDKFGIKVVDDGGTITDDTLEKGYTWIHNLDELQAMDKNKSGWYALRNSIDANATADKEYNDNKGFDSIGKFNLGEQINNPFTGRFDGLGYSIFGLNIDDSTTDNVGLFGYAQNATIRNFTLNSSEIKGGANTGAVVGHADGGKIENVTNTGNVTGGDGTGGIVGKAENNVAMSGLINIGKVVGKTDTGGVVGSMSDGSLGGDTYNLGSVTGTSSVGGIAGSVTDATIGNEVTQDNPDAFQIYNQLNVEGEYNVGGIAGTLSDSTITNAANHGNITATGFIDDNYKYHTAVTNFQNLDGATLSDGVATIAVKAANAGGIAGKTENSAKISNVVNEGDVTTKTEGDDNYYIAGNIGGIVGRAEDTTITNAENKENIVAGAHNVGGVAGFLGGVSSVEVGTNNGGDITATGARKYSAEADGSNGYAKERVRPIDGNELFNIGNIGGIVGYLFGDSAKIKNSGNRGTVHSAEIKDPAAVPETAKAANVGGVVGKIDTQKAADINDVKKQENNAYVNANVANSYNTGDVQGYTGVGGVAGMMYNGSIAGSYNLGTLKTTRQVDNSGGSNIDPLNMGGVVGDTTEETDASAVLYDVYNAGQIGDDTYTYYARHVGGVAGRLSGYIDKAYNTGNIYNRDTTVGGIVGWWNNGGISNVFNTGNITVRTNTEMQVGGIVGAASTAPLSLSYAYNLGTIRGFQDKTSAPILVGGIIGRARGGYNTKIDNVYTLGNIYAAVSQNGSYQSTGTGLGAIYGVGGQHDESGVLITDYTPGLTNANYITPENPTDGTKPKFEDLSKQANAQRINVVAYNDKSDANKYVLKDANNNTLVNNLDKRKGWSVNNGAWRLYEEGTPILNVFTPNMAAKDAWKEQLKGTGATVQYGTAYNPMLTILNLDKDVTFKWGDLGLYGAGGLAVYGGGLTIDGFQSAGDGRYFGGTIFSDHALAMNGTGTNFNLGSASKLYGSSVTLKANGGDISAYGEITSMNGDIEITGKNVEIIGSLTAKAQGKITEIDGISGASIGRMDTTGLNDPNKPMKSVSDMFTYTTGEAGTNGNITVNASGVAEVLYGNLGTGSVSTAGEFTIKGGVQEDGTLSGGSVYVDSDLSGTTGNINLSAGGEVLLDITNIAKANENDKDPNGAGALHKFLEKYKAEGGNSSLTLKSDGDDEIIAIDMWGDGTDTGSFALDKYNLGDDKTLRGAFDNLNIGNGLSAEDIVHIWISDAEQLKGIQSYYDSVTTTGETTKILNYNFALKGNIDASALTGYEEIGGGTTDGFSGTFDGRDFRIIGLNTNAADANNASSGIFGKLAGTVKDLRVYASKFFGGNGENAGTIASEVITQTKEDGSTVIGTITGVTTFGNTVTAEDGAAGGIAGKNSGSILESTASDSVTASGANAYAGGVAGVNTGSIGEKGAEGESAQITADSAVRSGTNGAAAIGGVVGKNENGGKVWLANSLGVTTGANAGSTGGIAGTNSGTMTSLYNESIVTGGSSVGGVAGDNSGTMTNAVNATRVTGTVTNTGGLVGNNSGTVDSGRNAGVITGKTSVGGMVGSNENSGILQNLSNAIVAAITGKNYVGGIAGSNAGSIKSDNNLTNEGTVSGTKYVGGIAGENKGTIENVLNETLVLKTEDGTNAMYFGGIAGTNSGTITNATNNSNVSAVGADGADGAEYVGGIVGQNTNTGTLVGELTNKGNVSGKDKVGGLAGENKNPVLLQGTKDENGETIRLVVTNAGKVSASGGSAGGIFYNNTEDIINADLTNTNEVVGEGNKATGGLFGTNSGNITNSTLTNTGTVTGNGVTGGLIGENSGAVTGGSKLTNSGTVKGGDNTGGLIGKNSGDVSFSSLINEYGAEVTGGDNTGGLIGKNTGEIKGGRGEGNDGMTMYTDKIYNNGTVSGASNVGGLIGNNAQENGKTGSLTAGYNTGVVNVTEGGSGENVGGIAGTNAGIIDQVFNTIMTGVDNLGATLFGVVTGKNNVGGIIGSNTGKLTNAYNTTGVTGTTNNIGNIVGKNTDTVKNVYATNETGTLVGDGNATDSYSFSEADNEKEGIIVIEPAAKNKQGSYEQFDFTGNSGTPAVWKIYEGKNGQEANGTPLLKVFLTNAEYSGETSFTYNGKNQGLSLDGVTVDGEKLSDVAKTLLSALTGKNAYDGYLGFTSEQIAASGEGNSFNPNNLGYDIDATFNIKKARLSVTLDDISRTYGDAAFTSISNIPEKGESLQLENENGYGYTLTTDKLTDIMENELREHLTFTQETDGAVDNVDTTIGQETNDAGLHKWTASLKLDTYLDGNYEFITVDDETSTTSATVNAEGNSFVKKATLVIDVNDAKTTYGTAFDDTKYGYTFAENNGLVNGDNETLFGNITLSNEAAKDGTNGKWTADAGEHLGALGMAYTGDLSNYEVYVNKGDAYIDKATLVIDVNDAKTTYGTAFDDKLYGYNFADGTKLVNGDTESIFGDVSYDNSAALDGKNNVWTADAGEHLGALGMAYTGDLSNYEVYVNKGDAYIDKATLVIDVNDAKTTYGTAFDDTKYGYTFAENNGLVNGDNETLFGNITLSNEAAKDGTNGKWTADAGEHLGALGMAYTGDLSNYEVYVNKGDAYIDKATLVIDVNNAKTTYGTAFDKGQYGYDIAGVTNGDAKSVIKAMLDSLGFEYDNTAEVKGEGDRVTVNAGENGVVSITNIDKVTLDNYTLVKGNDGVATVTKADLTIKADDQNMLIGTTPNFTGTTLTELANQLVNGDSLPDGFSYLFGVGDEAIFSEVGTHADAIGLFYNGAFYGGGLTGWGGVFANYDVNFVPGTLTVVPPSTDNYGHLHSDGWDRVRNFRERKAEVFFHEGGMEYDEDM